MKILAVWMSGKFDTESIEGDPEHRRMTHQVIIWWSYQHDGKTIPVNNSLRLERGYKCDGASRPEWIGWLVPRFGVFSLASFVHDKLFKTRPYVELKQGEWRRISRQHTDLLFLEIMRKLAQQRTKGWTQRKQLALAAAMYRVVRWFGEAKWDNHDTEFKV